MAVRNPAYGRYKLRLLGMAAAYLAAVAIAASILPDDAPANVGNVVLALVPGIAVLGMIWAIGRLLVELDDEYLRLLEVRKFIVATGVLLAVSSVWGLLELFTTVPRLPLFYAFPIWCGGLMIGAIVNRFSIGDTGSCA